MSEDVTTAAVLRLNNYLQDVRRTLEFSIDESTGRTVITVLDAETQQVIRQIPPEKFLAVARQLTAHESEDMSLGLLVQEKA
ncbi:MAG: flagellar protein FlaG [Chromatiaceae bacterium]